MIEVRREVYGTCTNDRGEERECTVHVPMIEVRREVYGTKTTVPRLTRVCF